MVGAFACVFLMLERRAFSYAEALDDVLVCLVDRKKFGLLVNWQREYTMEEVLKEVLTQLKKEMAAPHNRKLVQPPEGTFF